MPGTPHLTDEEIVRLLRSDDDRLVGKGIRGLYEKFRQTVEGIVRRLGGDLAQDPDLVLDDLALALKDHVRNDRWQESLGNLDAWGYRVAWNTELNLLRKRRNRKEDSIGDDARFDQLLTNQQVNEMEMDDELYKRVAEAIRKLDKPCQELLRQHLLEDKPLKDIAAQKEQLMDSEAQKKQFYDAIKKQHSRCKQKLRELLKNEFNK